ncbi:hypothetical protein PXK01_06175 [Phaeobacter sp. PT47_59]|uniref:hypothetical protein n=1 Tax=Phaeobacter sp. PT47_59 TaxID=3029979 RepID=UPI0023808300|nr:hypothetical protein [Phaeobacter sp. PT47_59]MDE4173733.1 hypothetical protein [Phaeobacter sp. PT47_59]
MAKTQTAPKSANALEGPAQALLSLSPLAGPQLHQFWEIQEKLLKETEAFTKHWFERRHTAARTALQATAAIFEKSPGDPAAAKVLRDWQMQSAERVSADIQEWIDLCTRSAEHVASGEAVANKETMDAVSETIKDAGHRHSTPV